MTDEEIPPWLPALPGESEVAKALDSGVGAPTVAHRDEEKEEMDILTGADAGAADTETQEPP